MKSFTPFYRACVIVSLTLLAGAGMAFADDPASQGKQYRQEVLNRLDDVQKNLDDLLAKRRLTPNQYQAESGKIKQLQLQAQVDAQEQDHMTKSDQETSFALIQQINQEVSQFTATNIPNTPAEKAVAAPENPAKTAEAVGAVAASSATLTQ